MSRKAAPRNEDEIFVAAAGFHFDGIRLSVMLGSARPLWRHAVCLTQPGRSNVTFT